MKKQYVVLVLLGLAIMVYSATQILGLATVIYDVTAPKLFAAYPPGSPSSPTTVSPANSILIGVWITDASLTGSPVYPRNVKVTITASGYSTTVALSYDDWDSASQSYYYKATWVSPSTTGIVYTLSWSAEDLAGNVGTLTTYAKTSDIDGYFTINGQRADQNTLIYVKTATLNFEFIATSLGAYIASVKIYVVEKNAWITLTETTTDQKWTGSYTLPAEGKYTINGYIYDNSNNGFQKMSLLTTFGEPAEPINVWWIGIALGLALIIIGIIKVQK